MPENVENIILEHLRLLRQGQDTISYELRELQARVSSLETAIIGVRRDAVHAQEDFARQQVSLDRLNERLMRIEKRLDLRETA